MTVVISKLAQTWTRSDNENFSVDLHFAVILALWLAENGHVTFITQ